MLDDPYLPLTDPREVESLAEELPIAVDRRRFQELILGFPRRYLSSTPRLEIVKHYLLMDGLGEKISLSSLSKTDGLWKMLMVTRERRGLFANIAGSLSCFGMNIRSAEAIANRASLVLDSFLFEDSQGLFDDASEKERFQEFLEGVLEGTRSFEEAFVREWSTSATIPEPDLEATVSNEAHPTATLLDFTGPDHFGLLFCLSRFLADENCSIHVASIHTSGGSVQDHFYMTREGSKLDDQEALALAERLEDLITGLLTRRIEIDLLFMKARALADS